MSKLSRRARKRRRKGMETHIQEKYIKGKHYGHHGPAQRSQARRIRESFERGQQS